MSNKKKYIYYLAFSTFFYHLWQIPKHSSTIVYTISSIFDQIFHHLFNYFYEIHDNANFFNTFKACRKLKFFQKSFLIKKNKTLKNYEEFWFFFFEIQRNSFWTEKAMRNHGINFKKISIFNILFHFWTHFTFLMPKIDKNYFDKKKKYQLGTRGEILKRKFFTKYLTHENFHSDLKAWNFKNITSVYLLNKLF